MANIIDGPQSRVYVAQAGFWCQRDILNYLSDISFLRYALNSPLSQVDPLGLSTWKADIVAKSFINGVGVVGSLGNRLGLGEIPAILLTLAPNPSNIPGNGAGLATARLQFLAAAINGRGLAAFNQNPVTDIKDGLYRLYTRVIVQFCCNGNSMSNESIVQSDMDGGNELPWINGTIHMSTPLLVAAGPSVAGVSWKGWGRPNLLVEPGMQWVALRTSVNIWHKVAVTLECINNQGVVSIGSFTGSKYPSHRLWINGGVAKKFIPQGPFSSLWTASAADNTFVA